MTLMGMFILGRCTKSQLEPERQDASTQRLKELNSKLQADPARAQRQAEESRKAAQETRAAMAMQETKLDALRMAARDLFQTLEEEMNDHAARCPFTQVIFALKRGECWHRETCHFRAQIAEQNMLPGARLVH